MLLKRSMSLLIFIVISTTNATSPLTDVLPHDLSPDFLSAQAILTEKIKILITALSEVTKIKDIGYDLIDNRDVLKSVTSVLNYIVTDIVKFCGKEATFKPISTVSDGNLVKLGESDHCSDSGMLESFQRISGSCECIRNFIHSNDCLQSPRAIQYLSIFLKDVELSMVRTFNICGIAANTYFRHLRKSILGEIKIGFDESNEYQEIQEWQQNNSNVFSEIVSRFVAYSVNNVQADNLLRDIALALGPRPNKPKNRTVTFIHHQQNY